MSQTMGWCSLKEEEAAGSMSSKSWALVGGRGAEGMRAERAKAMQAAAGVAASRIWGPPHMGRPRGWEGLGGASQSGSEGGGSQSVGGDEGAEGDPGGSAVVVRRRVERRRGR